MLTLTYKGKVTAVGLYMIGHVFNAIMKPWACAIKLFAAAINLLSKQPPVFAAVGHFRPSLMFIVRAGD